MWTFRFPIAVLNFVKNNQYDLAVEYARDWAVLAEGYSMSMMAKTKPTLDEAETWVDELIVDDRNANEQA